MKAATMDITSEMSALPRDDPHFLASTKVRRATQGKGAASVDPRADDSSRARWQKLSYRREAAF
jgi:hypothetical protein